MAGLMFVKLISFPMMLNFQCSTTSFVGVDTNTKKHSIISKTFLWAFLF